MSEKKVHFSEAELALLEKGGDGKPVTEGGIKKETRFKEKHSLDSDEEDSVDPVKVMDEDDIEGQEDSTIEFDEGHKITPFNMKDELEEGHFDSEGTYIFKKEKEIRDEWMDNIDWVKIHRQDHPSEKRSLEDSSDEDEVEQINEIEMYQDMIELMKPKETVTKALRRLGGGKAGITASSASQRLKAKKNKIELDPQKEEEMRQDKEKLVKLTALVDKLFQHGNHEIYQETYEKLSFLVKSAKESKTVIPEGIDADDAMDMFADDFDKKAGGDDESEEKSLAVKGDSSSGKDTESTSAPKSIELNEIMWEYKWKQEDTDIHGPFTSQQMADWVEDDYFPDGVFVRKANKEEGLFYSSKRMDFELYT